MPWQSKQVCPAQDHANITKSDATTYNPPFRSLYVGTAGDVVITSPEGNDATYKNVSSGTTLHVAGIKLKNASTASDFVAMY